MKNPILMLALLSTLGLAACDRSPTVVTVPTPVAVPGPAGPGPAGPQGNTGNTGYTGSTGATGATGKPGEGTTVIVMPAASGPAR